MLGLIVLVETDSIERLQNLASAVVNRMRPSIERDDHFPTCDLVEQHFGVAGGNDLTTTFLSRRR